MVLFLCFYQLFHIDLWWCLGWFTIIVIPIIHYLYYIILYLYIQYIFLPLGFPHIMASTCLRKLFCFNPWFNLVWLHRLLVTSRPANFRPPKRHVRSNLPGLEGDFPIGHWNLWVAAELLKMNGATYSKIWLNSSEHVLLQNRQTLSVWRWDRGGDRTFFFFVRFQLHPMALLLSILAHLGLLKSYIIRSGAICKTGCCGIFVGGW